MDYCGIEVTVSMNLEHYLLGTKEFRKKVLIPQEEIEDYGLDSIRVGGKYSRVIAGLIDRTLLNEFGLSEKLVQAQYDEAMKNYEWQLGWLEYQEKHNQYPPSLGTVL